MKTTVFSAVLAFGLMAGLPAGVVQAAANDAFGSFNGTQGAGNFFYGQSSAGVFTPYGACGPIDYPLTSCLGSPSYPYFGVAESAGPHLGVTLPTDRLLMHTAQTVNNTILWVAPEDGFYDVAWIISLHHPLSSVGNGIGVTLFFQPLGQALELTERFVVTSAGASDGFGSVFGAGDAFGFAIDANGWNGFDLGGINVSVSKLSAGVVPEPATWGMLIAGFGLVGASARRRRRVRAVC